MKQLNLIRNLFSVAVMMTLACNVSAQVSIRDRIQIMDRDIFNYPESTEAPVKTKKSKTNRIVYSDRAGNQSYEDPYFQRKRSSHGIGTPYYIVGEKNGTYKLVQADPDITGKPKSIIGFLYNSKRHFKEPRKVNYAGWIPSENILMYDHAYINPRNNQPIRYRIGINSINKLFDIHQFFNGDTLKIYGEPFLKTTTDAVVVSGEVVYLYKLDKSGKSALISNAPALSDSTKRFLGWIPADLLAEVGQNEVYHVDYSRYRDSLLCAVNLMYPETLALHNANIQGTILFNLDGNPTGPITDGNIRLNYPLSVWDKNWNKIINIKGGDIMVSDVRKMEAENKNVNIHVLFNDADLPYLSPYINVLQNLKLKMKPGYDYTFSATCISSNGENRHLAPTKDFSAWLDYIKQSISSKRKNEQEEQSSFYGFGGAIKQISCYDNESRFSNNVFIILGSKQTLSLHEQQLSWLATQPARLLFAQIDRASGTAYQDFLLQAKSILDSHSTKYIDHISNYIADNRLVKTELFKNIEATDANLYLYDAPYNSLTVGGILFPKGRNRLENNALETALDSVLQQSFETDSLLLYSLKDYERNIGVLRSRPTSELTHIFYHTENPDSTSLDDIDRNSVNDTYYIKASVADSIMNGYEYGYLLDDREVMGLLQSYRGLLPEFSDNIGKKELRVLRKQFKQQKKSINRSFYRKVLPRNPYLAQIFYYKTGVMANDSLLNSTKVKKLKKRKVELTDFNSGYTALISKMKRLEDMYQRNLFRPVFIAGMGDSYQNYFTALPSSIPTLPCPDVPLPVAHTQQAVVVSNEDPKKLGRVQVKMNWQTGPMQTSWIRVLTPDAGTSDKVATNRGFVFIPEKGDQVMVAFRYDDPNRPFVLGSLFHGKSGTGGGSSNKTKSLTTRSGCTITLDDEKGSVMMKDKEGNSYTADGEGNITISASKSITLCVGENKIMIDSEGNISSNAEKDITESAGANIAQSAENIDCTASSNYNISSTDFTASGSSSATVSGTTKATIDSSGTTAVAGTIVKLN